MKKGLAMVIAVIFAGNLFTGCSGEVSSTSAQDVVIEQTSGSGQALENGQSSAYVKLMDINYEDYITLGEYKNLTVVIDKVTEATEEEVMTEALSLYRYYVTEDNGGVKDRAVMNGDMVVMDYVGTKDGVAFEGGSDSNVGLVIGSGSFIDGFEDGLIGVMPGDTVELNLTFPEDFRSSELAGVGVVFTVTVHYIVPVEMEDSVIANFYMEDFDDVESLKQYVREYLEQEAQTDYQTNVENALFQQLFENCSYRELPETMIQQYRQNMMNHLSANAAVYGLDAETLISYYYGETMDLDTYLDQNVDVYLKYILTTMAIAKKENLIPAEEEMNARLEQLAKENGFSDLEEMIYYGYLREELEEQLICDDTVSFLLENVQIITK